MRALVVDDHPIMVKAIKTSLTYLELFDCIDDEMTLASAIARLDKDDQYDLLILDLNLGDATGTEALQIRERYPDLPVLVFSADESTETISKAFEQGVNGYIPKSSSGSTLVNAINTVLGGGVFVPAEAMQSLGFGASASGTRMDLDEAAALKLTPRQDQVFSYLLKGYSNKIIGRELDMAEGTVKTHLNTIYRLLGVNNRATAILKAQKLGLI